MPYCVAVCGGIASGKSSICTLLEIAGATLVDADIIARDLVKPNEPALYEIEQRLGSQFILKDGSLDRVALRTHVFSDPKAKQILENILHPRIQSELLRQSEQAKTTYVAVAIPLLSPSTRIAAYAWINRVMVVETPELMQQSRIMARDGCSLEIAKAMIAAQLSYQERLSMADDVVINDASIELLQQWATRLHERYLSKTA
ncbi:MAG TPA: dephospho-CoA kinase [Arenimonas sp.]|nr:dephospho-CoA kinase [Arenimonas sp.]